MYMHDHPNRHYVFVRLSVPICLYASLCTRNIQRQSTCFKPPACFCHTVISKKTLNSCLVRSNASTTDTGPKGARYHRDSFSHYSPGCDTMPTDLASAKESMAAKARARNTETPCTWRQPMFAGKKKCQNASKKKRAACWCLESAPCPRQGPNSHERPLATFGSNQSFDWISYRKP